jgi:hypothetical protein
MGALYGTDRASSATGYPLREASRSRFCFREGERGEAEGIATIDVLSLRCNVGKGALGASEEGGGTIEKVGAAEGRGTLRTTHI